MRRRGHLRQVTSSETGHATLTAVLSAEDLAQELGLDPHARVTCGRHRCWLHQCVALPEHVVPFTGQRWCRPCRRALDVHVDGTTAVLFCPRCGYGTPDTAANRQVVQACRTSIAAMHAR
ncbi:hypothetical protein [Lentzea jiangxiensis]|uniref:Uncharacterized protein n=1 Tax=Lentzea jiangxiensis TaxID=641025 RepID=A0A1H0U4K2_9PSEU|nr:hypothetical protein [Lentzea jiangxiensis]SDP61123.1 hypothetical protein SAMN05421507_111108 [Lentzea jiangxiensis]